MRILCHVLSVETDTDGATSQTELLRGAKTERIVLRRQRKQQDSLSELKGDITCGGTRVEIYSPTCVRLKEKNKTDSWQPAANILHRSA